MGTREVVDGIPIDRTPRVGLVRLDASSFGGGVALLSRKPSEPVPACFDNHKGLCEFFLCVGIQHPLQFGMNGILSGRQYSEIQDSGA